MLYLVSAKYYTHLHGNGMFLHTDFPSKADIASFTGGVLTVAVLLVAICLTEVMNGENVHVHT